jgi:hypothetical protein
MGNSLWFITLLQEKPLAGFAIGLVFLAFMFGAKNLVMYLYTKKKERKSK